MAGCTPVPTGPTIVLITVGGLPQEQVADPEGPLADFLSKAWSAKVAPGEHGLAADLASALCGKTIEPLSGEPFEVVLPPDVDTLPEVFSRYGLETAAYLTDARLVEELGFFQGSLHGGDLPLLIAEATSGPLRGAVELAHGFLEQKLPRPMEDASFVWLHLDLGLIPEVAARGRFLGATLRNLNEALEVRPDSALALLCLSDQPGDASLLAAQSPWTHDATLASELNFPVVYDALLAVAGHTVEDGVAVRVGEPREILREPVAEVDEQ